MTKSVVTRRDAAAAVREPRPFLFLKPARLPLREQPIDAVGLERLEQATTPSIAQLSRALVDFTIVRQNRAALPLGSAQPIQLSVLNRRRRAARSWLNAIAAGRTDAATRHAVAGQWLPILCGTGPEPLGLFAPARELVEFVRGAVTACIFDDAREDLLPDARALHVLETTLAAHLAGVREVERSPAG